MVVASSLPALGPADKTLFQGLREPGSNPGGNMDRNRRMDHVGSGDKATEAGEHSEMISLRSRDRVQVIESSRSSADDLADSFVACF